MKNILNKVGAVSKPVLFGAALGIATVAVGVGVLTNLGSDGPKGASGRALSHYSTDTASVGSGAGGSYEAYSKEVLEQQLAAAQAAREGNTALEYLGNVGKGRFAYNNATAHENATINPMAMNNAAYEGQASAQPGMSPEVSGMMNQFNQTASAAAANAGKGAGKAGDKAAVTGKGKLEKGNSSASGTQVNRLNSTGRLTASAKGASSKGGSGATHNLGTIQGYAGDKVKQQPIAPVDMGTAPQGNIAGIGSAKHGRLGAMGGSNSRGTSGSSGGGNGQAYFSNTLGDLVHANKYSALAKGSVYGNVEKGFENAAASFDGSEENTEGVQIDGNTPIVSQAANLLEREANKIPNMPDFDISTPMSNIQSEYESVQKAQNQLRLATMAMIAGAAAVAFILGSWKPVTPWGWAAKIAVLVAGIAGIWSIYGFWMLENINILKNATHMPNAVGSWGWKAPLIAGLCTVALGVGFFSEQIGKKLSEWSDKLKGSNSKFVQTLGDKLGNMSDFLGYKKPPAELPKPTLNIPKPTLNVPTPTLKPPTPLNL